MKTYLAAAVAALIALVVTWALGLIVIPFLHKINFGQNILTDIGPSWHRKKQGTPTMGGIMFIAGFAVALAVTVPVFKALGTNVLTENCETVPDLVYTKLFAGFIMTAGMALIGFADDYIKIKKHQNEGLSVMQKTALQLVVIIAFLFTLTRAGADYTVIPYFHNNLIESHALFWIIGIPAIYCTVNAVNFTDGVDGLCSSVSLVMCAFFAICAVLLGFMGLSVPCGALLGALLGFVIWNRNPAKIMMGDAGSLFIGGLMCTFAYCLNAPWLIILICFIHALEFATVVIQNAYALTHRGRKLFKMAPLHHHYEKSGWSENRICTVFCAISALCGCAAVALCYFGITVFRI